MKINKKVVSPPKNGPVAKQKDLVFKSSKPLFLDFRFCWLFVSWNGATRMLCFLMLASTGQYHHERSMFHIPILDMHWEGSTIHIKFWNETGSQILGKFCAAHPQILSPRRARSRSRGDFGIFELVPSGLNKGQPDHPPSRNGGEYWRPCWVVMVLEMHENHEMYVD